MMSCSARDLLCLPSKHLATSQDRIKYFSDELPRVLEIFVCWSRYVYLVRFKKSTIMTTNFFLQKNIKKFSHKFSYNKQNFFLRRHLLLLDISKFTHVTLTNLFDSKLHSFPTWVCNSTERWIQTLENKDSNVSLKHVHL